LLIIVATCVRVGWRVLPQRALGIGGAVLLNIVEIIWEIC
jgi:hypothetical protein